MDLYAVIPALGIIQGLTGLETCYLVGAGSWFGGKALE